MIKLDCRINNNETEGIAYIGFHFICLWDEEHDFGVMTHKERIVKVGGADTAFLSWIAEEDKSNYGQDKQKITYNVLWLYYILQIRYDGKQLIINKETGQIIDFYQGTSLDGFIKIERIQ